MKGFWLIAALFVAGAIVGALSGAVLGFVSTFALLKMDKVLQDSEGSGLLYVFDSAVGAFVGLIISLAVVAHRSKSIQ